MLELSLVLVTLSPTLKLYPEIPPWSARPSSTTFWSYLKLSARSQPVNDVPVLPVYLITSLPINIFPEPGYGSVVWTYIVWSFSSTFVNRPVISYIVELNDCLFLDVLVKFVFLVKRTEGAVEYPPPGLVIEILVIAPRSTVANALPPDPPPPFNKITGGVS